MAASSPQKAVRSYRLVFRRRWRIFRLQGWRIPLPGGLELRALGYWLACLGLLALPAQLPLVGAAFGAIPSSLRFFVLPVVGAWALSRWAPDGRSPHRAILGIVLWWLRPRSVAALRRCPRVGEVLAPPEPIALAPDLRGPRYPRGRLRGPVRVLLRYPVAVEPLGGARRAGADGSPERARRWRVRQAGSVPLARGHTLEVPTGREVVFR